MNCNAEKNQIELDYQLDEEIIVYGDADRLEQVVTNVLHNAYRYSHKGSRIEVRLFANDHAVLQIQDYGQGIPEKDLPKIMERFYRVNKARTRKDGGAGLGLAIVYQIVKKHGGDISIQSQLGQGTTVTITLPMYQE